jgi:hypothetical protein
MVGLSRRLDPGKRQRASGLSEAKGTRETWTMWRRTFGMRKVKAMTWRRMIGARSGTRRRTRTMI